MICEGCLVEEHKERDCLYVNVDIEDGCVCERCYPQDVDSSAQENHTQIIAIKTT